MFHSLESYIRDEFLQERELKNGEKGVVSLLREKRTGKRYVCHRFCGSGEAYEALRGVACPNLPRVLNVASKDGTVLVLEEYIQGDRLDFLLEERPLGEEQAREILIQVCRGLKVLHSLGVVHRDVKPENIILRGDEAVLIDFDISRVCKEERNNDTRIMGTAGYAAPEQFGFSQTDARADIFSVGVMLNEMLSRRHPSQELADGPLRCVIEKCIEVNVDKRYTSVDELQEALSAKPSKGKKNLKWWRLPVVLIVFFSAVWLGTALEARYGEQVSPAFAAPDSVGGASMAVEQGPEPTETEGLQSVALQTEKILWHEDPNVFATGFRYDLDGDGKGEEYLFAAMFDFAGVPRLLQHSGDTINDGPEVLNVAGAVWKQTGENDYEPVEEFAALLTESTVAVRQIAGEQAGIVEKIDPLYGLWPGAVRGTFDSVGYWHYECSAVLNGETLAAVGTTRTERLEEETDAAKPTKPSSVDSAPILAMIQTDGAPVGEPVCLEFSIRDDLKEGTYEIYSYTAQHLDNGYIRFSLDYVAPKISSITAFDPPDGALFRYSDRSGTSGERELLVFDLPEELLREARQFTITFNCGGQGGRFLIFTKVDVLL